MRFKHFVFIQIILIIGLFGTLSADEVCRNKLLSKSSEDGRQCGSYAFEIVKPLLDYFRENQNKIKTFNIIIDKKESAIRELEEKLVELQLKYSDSMQRFNNLDVYKQLDDTKTGYIQDLRKQITTLENLAINCKSSSNNESNQVAELQTRIAAHLDMIKEQNGKIDSLEKQIILDTEKMQVCENQLKIKTSLVEDNEEFLTNIQNMASILNEDQVQFEESNKLDEADSCIPFANSPGIHKINIPGFAPSEVLCANVATGPGWIVIQQRINGKENFYRNWANYRAGFGSLDGDFFLGLEKIHRLTTTQRHELYIHLERFNGEVTFANYDDFAIADEEHRYNLIKVDGFSGNTTDSLDKMAEHKGKDFRTFDRDNWIEMAKTRQGGWWYRKSSTASNLNGKYFDYEVVDKTANFWYGSYSLKKVQMLIRPKID